MSSPASTKAKDAHSLFDAVLVDVQHGEPIQELTTGHPYGTEPAVAGRGPTELSDSDSGASSDSHSPIEIPPLPVVGSANSAPSDSMPRLTATFVSATSIEQPEIEVVSGVPVLQSPPDPAVETRSMPMMAEAAPPDAPAGRTPVVGPERTPDTSRATTVTKTVTVKEPRGPLLTPVEIGTSVSPRSGFTQPTTVPVDPRIPVSVAVPETVQHLLAQRTSRPGQSVRIRLDPPHLGDLEVEISVRASRVSVTLRTENAEASDLVKSHLDAIRQVLTERGLTTEQISLLGPDEGSRRRKNKRREKDEKGKGRDRMDQFTLSRGDKS